MIPEVTLVAKPAVDFNKLVTVCYQTLGYSPAKACDSSRKELPDIEKFVSILAAINNPDAPVKLDFLEHVGTSVLIVADTHDAIDILQSASMATVSAETVVDGIYLCVLSGTLAQWRDALARGLGRDGNTKTCFGKIAAIFSGMGLHDLNHSARPEKTRLLGYARAT